MGEIVLLRHLKTCGNTKGRYIGSRTDEPLLESEKMRIRGRSYPSVEKLYVSPMKRCLETARWIWPEQASSMKICSGLRECDFGEFENKNYLELSGNPSYQAWIDSGGTLPFPGGESMEAFRQRCLEAFEWIVKENKETDGRIAIVAHGGTIMAILEHYGTPERGYFDYQVKNGEGYLLTPVEGTELWNCQYLQ